MKIAVQMYSLRNLIERVGIKKVFERLSAIGIDGIEMAGYYGKTLKDMQDMLAFYNLKPISAHVHVDTLIADFNNQLSYITGLGLTNIVNPIFAEEDLTIRYDEVVFKLNKAAELLKKHGVGLSYHNHYMEFQPNNDLLLKLVNDVRGMTIQLDTFWVKYSGIDCVSYIEKNHQIIKSLHLKELSIDGKDAPNPIIGEGIASLDKIVKVANKYDINWGIIEVESFSINEFDYIKTSMQNIKKMIKDEQND